jgi:hypothetical protein
MYLSYTYVYVYILDTHVQYVRLRYCRFERILFIVRTSVYASMNLPRDTQKVCSINDVAWNTSIDVYSLKYALISHRYYIFVVETSKQMTIEENTDCRLSSIDRKSIVVLFVRTVALIRQHFQYLLTFSVNNPIVWFNCATISITWDYQWEHVLSVDVRRTDVECNVIIVVVIITSITQSTV